MSKIRRPQSAMFQHLIYDNYYLRLQIDNLSKTNHTLEANISELNRFIMTQYDVSFNVMENLRIVTFDGSGSVIACIHSDLSGNFVSCTETSGGYLPCVLPPIMEPMLVPDKKISKTHVSDASRCFPYGPYYGYGYGYPYYGYPYYPYLYDDDYLYRGMDLSGVKMPVHPPMHPSVHPSFVQAPTATHIHIHNK